MSIFISLVGFQPSATAVAIKTWAQHKGPPQHILLLATPQVRNEQAKWLKDFLTCLFPSAKCEILDISTTLEPGQSSPSALGVIKQKLQELEASCQIVFCGDPGPKFLVVSIAQVLPPDAIFLHADTHYLYCGTFAPKEEWEQYPLENLGMQSLLSLYNLCYEANPGLMSCWFKQCLQRLKIQLPPNVFQGFKFKVATSLPALDLAYERGGWFFGLVMVDGQPFQQKQKGQIQQARLSLPQSERKKLLEQVRKIQRMVSELCRLQPVLTIVSGSRFVRTRAEAAGLQAISPKDYQALQDWVEGRAKPPGHVVIPDTIPPSQPLKPCRGGGGTGQELVVWIGPDPSATLVSLCTHKPSKAWVLYDAGTEGAVEMARRLQGCAKRLPVGHITFLKSDILGRGVIQKLLSQPYFPSQVKVDVTAGRKAQGCALARLTGAQLWSLRQDVDQAMPLMGGCGLPLQGPDIITQARMVGGRLHSMGKDASAWGSYSEFLLLLGKFLAEKLQKCPRTSINPLTDMELDGNWLRVEGNMVEVHYGGKHVTHTLKLKGGYWFEMMVASALMAAGADEVRVGVKWAWPQGLAQHLNSAFRDEVDVVARFGHRFIAVSCKIGTRRTLAAVAREIEAVALRCLGRFAVPIVIRPRVDPQLKAERLSLRQGAAYLDLTDIVDLSSLEKALQLIWSNRRTLREEG